MLKKDFIKLANQGNHRVSVSKIIKNFVGSPLQTYKILDNKNSFLFESGSNKGKWSRYSIVGTQSNEMIKVNDNVISYINNGETKEIKSDDPLDWIEKFYTENQVANLPKGVPFSGGLVGYFGYETIKFIEKKLDTRKKDSLNVPDIFLFVCNEIIIFDNLENSVQIIINAKTDQEDSYEKSIFRMDEIEKLIYKKEKISSSKNIIDKSEFTSSFKKENFMDAVNKTKEYISAGDVMQVVLSQRLTKNFNENPIDMYEALRDMNPSPYMYFLDMDGFQIIGSSPEILVKLEDKKVTVRPIAGTRPRGANESEDLQNEKDLLNDPKELAEHLMLIDLGRNDIGRISKVGSVELTEKMIIERYSHVMHIVSNVDGTVNDNTKPLDVLRATFPAGTVSGAPKIRAMEIINELEPLKRGIYSGAIGYLSWTGDLDTALSIRTAVIKDNLIHVQAGAGIVYDSVPETEWEETMNKAMALLKASEKANASNEDK
ncbi:anthranilate synthase component I [Gammaproteobacteria bacterium]|nr:anthranilate synthase component I [Gammaproteobacteria bacterium]